MLPTASLVASFLFLGLPTDIHCFRGTAVASTHRMTLHPLVPQNIGFTTQSSLLCTDAVICLIVLISLLKSSHKDPPRRDLHFGILNNKTLPCRPFFATVKKFKPTETIVDRMKGSDDTLLLETSCPTIHPP